MFFGRKDELKKLNMLLKKKTASLVIVRGRRRIGKSTLIQELGKRFDFFCEIQGLAPRDDISDADQRKNFSEQMKNIFDIPAVILENWNDAFAHLSSHTRIGKNLVLLDEISWMSGNDSDFPGKLKIAWDTRFKKNDQLVLVLCGSASSWIDKNILKDTDFVGRISLEINLEELPLSDCNKFWQNKKMISSMEKLKLLSVTGGVPKYLEEINIKESAEENIKRICFDKGGILVSEFEKIFNDIFDKRAKIYKSIVNVLAKQSCSVSEIAALTGRPRNGDISEYLNDLEVSGFINRDYVYNFKGRQSRLSKYRIKDNYLRFYLKYMDPIKDKIEKGLFRYTGIESLPGWSAIIALQFENLVLHNISSVIKCIGIDFNSIVSASPYFQNHTRTNKGACQIDLLIQTKFNTIYLCEIKFQKKIKRNVVNEIEKKMAILKRPKNTSIRPVLIYEGDISESVLKSDCFDKVIYFGDLLAECS
jgi:uncharacterized protein